MPKKAWGLRQGRRLLVRSTGCHVALLACIGLCGLSCGCSKSVGSDRSIGADASADDPCADVLQIKSPAATLPCPLGKEAICVYLQSTGKDVEVHFSLNYYYNAPKTHSGDLDQTANQHYQQCIIKYLADNGLSGFVDSYDRYFGQVSVKATYAQVVSVASRLAVFTYYDVDCYDGATCVDCLPLDTDQCAATPICHLFWGEPVDVTQDCIGAAQPLGCLPLTYDDSGTAQWRRDPQGNCWLAETTTPSPRALDAWSTDLTCGLPGGMPFPFCHNPPTP